MKKTFAFIAGTVLVLAGFASSIAAAAPTPPPAPSLPIATELLAGKLEGPEKAQNDGISLRTRGDTSVRMFTLTYLPGNDSGWHEHPGIVIATVRSGKVIQQVGCRSYERTAGEAFTEDVPHRVFNPSREPALLEITQIVPFGLTDLRDEVDPPKCRGRQS